MEGKEITLLPGDVNSDGEVNIADANALINILLGAASQPCSSLLADANADGELNIADVNMIIDLILKI